MSTNLASAESEQYTKVIHMMSKSDGVSSFEIIQSDSKEYVTIRLCFECISDSEHNAIDLRLRRVTQDDLSKMIQKQNVDLDFCYIENFEYSKFGNFYDIKTFNAFCALFDGDTDFNEATFLETVDFTGAMFRGNVYFENTNFVKGDISFDFSQCTGLMLFSAIKIAGSISFEKAKINGLDLDRAYFPKKVSFGLSRIKKLSIFLSIFSNDSESSLSFISAIIDSLCIKNSRLLSHQTYDLQAAKRIEIIDSILGGIIELSMINKNYEPSALALINTTSTAVIHADWETIKKAVTKYRSIGQTYFDASNQLLGSDSEDKIEYNTYNAKCDSLIIFKENYHNLGKYVWEDEAYVEFKRNERKKSLINLKTQKYKLWKKTKNYLSFLIDLIGEYGTNPGRVAVSMAIVFFVYSILFGISLKPYGDTHWWSGFYFSGITFLTIGYGDITPKDFFSSVLAISEGFIGLFLMSYFSVAVVRKTLR